MPCSYRFTCYYEDKSDLPLKECTICEKSFCYYHIKFCHICCNRCCKDCSDDYDLDDNSDDDVVCCIESCQKIYLDKQRQDENSKRDNSIVDLQKELLELRGEVTKLKETFQEQLTDLQEQIKYLPGNQVYQEAKEHFEGLLESGNL